MKHWHQWSNCLKAQGQNKCTPILTKILKSQKKLNGEA